MLKLQVHLLNLSDLQYLNLAGTKITANGVERLKGLKNLRQLYLYQTSISGAELTGLKGLFPKTTINTGGYLLEKLESDSTLVIAPAIR